MLLRRFFPATVRSWNPLSRSIRTSARDPFPSKVSHYLYRAKVIDAIRLALRSNSASSLSASLNDRLLDSFIVAQAIRSSPSADCSLSIIETLKSNSNFTHTQSTVHALASMLAKFGRRVELDALVDSINSRSFKNVCVSYMNLMKWYAEMEDLDSVLDAWDKYRKESDKRVCAESYNIMMRLYAHKGLDSEAVDVFYRMTNEGAIPNCRTFTIMIEHLVKSGRLDSAFEVFQILPRMRIKRTLKQYSILVEEFIRVERFNEAGTLLNEMRAEGILPGRALFSSLQTMRDSGHIRETDDLLCEMLPDGRIRSVEYYASNTDDGDSDEDENDGENKVEDVNELSNGIVAKELRLKPWFDPGALAGALNSWNPDEVLALENAKFVWTTRLVCKILRNFKSPESAWNFFCWVACQPGFTHDVYTVQRMMTLLARHGRVQLVDQLMLKIAREGIKLPYSTIKLIIEFYGLSKNPDAALKVFRHGKALCGTISNFNLMVLYSTLLRTLTKCSRESDALSLLDEMILNGICPDAQTFSGLMDHFALEGDIKIVQKLFTMVKQSGLEPNGYMFKVLICGYCKCNRAALAWRIFEDMRYSGLMPDAPTKDLLVKSLWKEGKRKEAAAVEESCDRVSGSLPLALRGHVWTVSSADLDRVYDIYASSFMSCDGSKT
ncbi:hypothetical protein CDL15_Pgr014172 [Punica granatum]|uniref:Pentatricopeptide repeat-containing protein At5g66631 n=1 Tax=Punica granatum TaxID=22663 RepID=A0A218XJF9_PUNGR|nr:hypothetical protein CDL15_Pgr014172 [Punica granatum]